MDDLTILREKNPTAAEFVEGWQKKYQGDYDFSLVEDQALFYEGMVEMARYVAKNNSGAGLKVSTSTTGVQSISVNLMPVPCAS